MTRFATLLAGVAFCALPAVANAGQIVNLIGYDTPDLGAYNSVDTPKPGGGSYGYYTGPIVLHFSDHADVAVFCADLSHFLHTGQYEFGLLTTDGLGNAISPTLSHRLGVIATLGLTALASNNFDLATAAQAAIWDREYNVVSATANGTIGGHIANLVGGIDPPSNSYAVALIPYGQGWSGDSRASQQMIVGLAADVPEPASLGILGLGVLGLGMVRAHRNKVG